MNTESSNSDSSDDDEATERLKAAVSEELTMHMCTSKPTSHGKKTKEKSIRQELYEERHAEESDLKTTPEFREHVSKKLEKYYNNLLSHETTPTTKISTNKNNSETESVIRLLSSSKSVVTVSKSTQAFKKTIPTRKPISSESDSEAENERLAAVVVDGQYILENGSLHKEDSGNLKVQVEDSSTKKSDEEMHCKKQKLDCNTMKKKKKHKLKKHK
ncbi:uncharacterized protein LOC144748596 [Ciona intestinalis]